MIPCYFGGSHLNFFGYTNRLYIFPLALHHCVLLEWLNLCYPASAPSCFFGGFVSSWQTKVKNQILLFLFHAENANPDIRRGAKNAIHTAHKLCGLCLFPAFARNKKA